MIKRILSLVAVSVFLFSCSSNDDEQILNPTESDLSEGIIIVNEGNFGTSNASISALTQDFTSISNQIFRNANNRSVGDVAQSIAFNNNLAFIVVNGSNVIEVVNKTNFVSVATITEQMASPRFAVVENNKLYVTHMYANKVTVYDANSFNYLQTILLDFQPELILESNDKLYVSSNFYAGTNKLAVINTNTNTVDTTVNLPEAINGLTTGNNIVYVLTTNDAYTKVHTLTNNEITNVVNLPITNARYLEFDSNKLYFTSNLSVYELATTGTNATQLFTVTDNSWSSLYGFEVFDGKIFTSDAKGFTEDGVVTVYNTAGSVLKTFRAGVGPNGFYKD